MDDQCASVPEPLDHQGNPRQETCETFLGAPAGMPVPDIAQHECRTGRIAFPHCLADFPNAVPTTLYQMLQASLDVDH